MTTEKLYYRDPYQKEFSAAVLGIRSLADGDWGVVLDRTAFYPEGGGQPCDTGCLDDIPVRAVYEEAGEIVHVAAAKPAAPQVAGRLDWGRRFDHMQQHSGEHLLSAVFADLLGCENVGFHLGADGVYIDVTLNALTPEQAAAVEDAANARIFANLKVSGQAVGAADLGRFPLRKQPAKDFASIRLVTIDGVDCCPCGGTHVAATGEIGLVKIRSWERRAGTVRVDFVCGGRALADYRLNSMAVRELTARLSVPAAELPAALQRQLARQEALHKELQTARQDLNRYLAAEMYGEAERLGDTRLIARRLDGGASPAEAADLARQILAAGRAVVLLATANAEQNKSQLLFACTPGIAADMGALLKKALPAVGGKGGGNRQWAQGGGSFSANLEDALRLAREDVLKLGL